MERITLVLAICTINLLSNIIKPSLGGFLISLGVWIVFLWWFDSAYITRSEVQKLIDEAKRDD